MPALHKEHWQNNGSQEEKDKMIRKGALGPDWGGANGTVRKLLSVITKIPMHISTIAHIHFKKYQNDHLNILEFTDISVLLIEQHKAAVSAHREEDNVTLINWISIKSKTLVQPFWYYKRLIDCVLDSPGVKPFLSTPSKKNTGFLLPNIHSWHQCRRGRNGGPKQAFISEPR